MPFEQFTNNATTTLNGAITNVATSLIVTSATNFPSTGNFRILIGAELMLVTSVSGATFTVTRSIEGTSNVSHSDTDPVTLILTEGSLQRWGADYQSLFDLSTSLPGPVNSLTDGVTVLTKSSFTWINQGTSTDTDLANGAIQYDHQKAIRDSIRIAKRTAPTAPYIITAAFAFATDGQNTNRCGMCFRDGTGKLYIHSVQGRNKIDILRMTNPTTFSGTAFGANVDWFTGRELHWMRLEDDNTNVKFHHSPNGIQWQEIHSESRTTFMASGPTEVGVFNNPDSTTQDTGFILVHWSVA